MLKRSVAGSYLERTLPCQGAAPPSLADCSRLVTGQCAGGAQSAASSFSSSAADGPIMKMHVE